MQNSKVIRILKVLSASEFSELEKFISSPFFAKGRNVVPLYKYLKKYYPEFSSSKMTYEDAYSKTYPGKKFSLQAIRNLLTALQKMCEDYLFLINVRRDKPDYYIHLSDELQRRRLFNSAEKIIGEGLNKVKVMGVDSSFFYQRYMLENINDQMLQGGYRDEFRSKGISRMSSYFLSYFLNISNFIIQTIHTNSYNLNKPVDFNPLYIFLKDFIRLDEFTNYLKNNNSEFSEIDEIHLCMIKLCINAGDESAYLRLRGLLRNNFGWLSRTEAYITYVALERITVLLELKDEKYKGLLFDVYKEELKYNIYSPAEDRPMHPGFYTGIVAQAVAAGEYKWAHDFIRKYKNRLLPEVRESRFNHSLAAIAFAEKDYEKALKLISKIKYETFVFRYYLKVLLLKIYYELNRYEEARSVIDTFRHFISTTKYLPQFRKDKYSAFIKYTAQLLKLREDNHPEKLDKLKAEIENQPLLVERSWLLEKIGELDAAKK